jgi:hypothetical protein
VTPGGPHARTRARAAAFRLTLPIIVLGALASGAGLFAPQVYRETAWALPQIRGQDLVTLAALPILLFAAFRASGALPGGAPPTRWLLVWVGVLGYVLYTYTAAAFTYHFNQLFLIYVGLFSLSLFALLSLSVGMDADAAAQAVDASLPRRGFVAFLLVFAAFLAFLWLGQIAASFLTGELPELIVLADTPSNFVYVLDLGVVVPLSLVAAAWLRAGRPWGIVLTGAILVKAVTMALALVSMTLFAAHAGSGFDPTLGALWIALAGASLSATFVFFRHCH